MLASCMSMRRRPASYEPRGCVCAAQISKLHEEVSRVLWAMGVFHVDDAITPDGLFCVDIALEGEKACPPNAAPSISSWRPGLSRDATAVTASLHQGLWWDQV